MSSAAWDILTGKRPKSDLIETITIETRFTPPIVITKPFADNGAPPNPLLALLRPRVTITSPVRNTPFVSQPWGDPGQSLWPQVKIAFGALAIISAALAVHRFIK